MPLVGTKHFSYTGKGKQEAKAYAKNTGKKLVMKPKKTGAKRGR